VKEIGTLADWSRMMAHRPSSHDVFADFYPTFVDYLSGHHARYDCRRDITEVSVPPAAVDA
jgi:hypothetical protein